MRLSWWWLCSGLVLLTPTAVVAQQCASGFVSASPASSNACSGNNVYESRIESRSVQISTSVSCNQSGYFGAPVSATGWFVEANGQCGQAPAGFPPDCHGQVDEPSNYGYDMYEMTWKAQVGVRHWGWTGGGCAPTAPYFIWTLATPAEDCYGYTCCSDAAYNTCVHGGGNFSSASCECNFTPIILSLDRGDLQLTDAAHGVNFDLSPDGEAERLGWTRSGSDDAFLVLDRNQNGRVDDGRELFGSATEQPPEGNRHGFRALAVFDANGDKRIDAADPAYASLQLWSDRNHDGKSDAGELQTLDAAGIVEISLQYRSVSRTDRHGNAFMYVANVSQKHGKRLVKRLAWDVALTGR
jgi:hypothetical protein